MSEILSKVTCDYIPEGDSCGLVATLVEQNANLRELMEDVLRYINRPCDGSCTHLWAKKERDSINERAQELGIEVPS